MCIGRTGWARSGVVGGVAITSGGNMGDTAGLGIEGVGDGRRYIVFNM